jgi:hypothetical protein
VIKPGQKNKHLQKKETYKSEKKISRVKQFITVSLLVIFLAGCEKKTGNEPTVFSLKEMSDLATVEYTVTKIIKASDNKTWFKMGDRKILMSCEAHIKAGIDMSAINESSFKIDGKNIEVTLPAPKIISFSIPPESIKTEYEDIGILRDNFKSGDRNALVVQAQKQIQNSLNELGILDQAKANTALFVTNFLKKLGYENIRVNYNGRQPVNQLQ